MQPVETIGDFDRFLAERELTFEGVIVGGTALGLLGVVKRQTKDCDVLVPELPMEIREAAQEFAASVREAGGNLDADWLNNGPAALVRDLPSGWEERLIDVFEGDALTLRSLGRSDLLRSKLFALCDRGIDLNDCLALTPTMEELAELTPWLEERDGNAQWTAHVRDTLADLARRLGHAV